MKKQQGFTLIELMIVVAVIGALSAFAFPAYQNYLKKSEMTSAVATLKSLITPAELLFQENGTIGTELSELGIDKHANTLGEISIAGETLVFEFKKGSLDGGTVTYTRDEATGWSCEPTPKKDGKMPDVEGCTPKPSTSA